jgi:glycosyltransferase involved in cell wall biosynthesis
MSMQLAVVTCWPLSVATGSGTAVAQHGLSAALASADASLTTLPTSSFASTRRRLILRALRNAARMPNLDRYDAVLGVDGEGWLWARRHPQRPYIALTKAVLCDILQFEQGTIRMVLRVQAGWEAASAQRARAVITASAYAADRLAAGYGVPRAKIQVVPEPFDFDRWQAQLPDVAREPLVLAVGHAYPRKNYAALIAAWATVARERPDARLVLVGHGPETPALRQFAAALPSIEFLGHVSFRDLLGLYARAQVFCHPSLQENFGIAVVEGLASGLGVVVHEQPAVVETVTGMPGTWVTDARDPARLAAALLDALSGPPGWPDARLRGLRARLAPEAVGRQVRAIVEAHS